MDTLPEEMLLEIMEYLRYSDLKCFRLVCKKFYEASLTFRIVNRDNFVCRRYNIDDSMKISTTERNFYHFHFVKTVITVGFREFVEKRAKFILSLKFDRCKIMDPMNFCESINECIKLKSLELHYMSCPLVWNRAATISLPALETMDISRIPGDMFDVLMNTNVKNLHLRVYYDHFNRVICTRGRLEDLKCLNLSDELCDAQLMNIADKLNLTSIHINCRGVTDQCFKYFVEKQRGLQIVELCNPMFITDESLVAIAENLKDLKELIFYAGGLDDVEYSFDALNRIINSTPVRCIHVGGSVYVSGLVTTVGDVPVEKCLRQLHMWGVHNETHVTYIAENFLSLTQLTLMESDGVTNETLQLICQNLKNLKILDLTYCECIGGFEHDDPRLTFSANFNNLEELNLTWSLWLSDSILDTCFKLPSLRILDLTFCKKLTVKSFVAMPKNFPCLEDLNMVGLEVDKDILLSTVSLMKRLCKLKIDVSEPITELELKSLYEHSDSLHRVNFARNTESLKFIRSWERKTFVNARL